MWIPLCTDIPTLCSKQREDAVPQCKTPGEQRWDTPPLSSRIALQRMSAASPAIPPQAQPRAEEHALPPPQMCPKLSPGVVTGNSVTGAPVDHGALPPSGTASPPFAPQAVIPSSLRCSAAARTLGPRASRPGPCPLPPDRPLLPVLTPLSGRRSSEACAIVPAAGAMLPVGRRHRPENSGPANFFPTQPCRAGLLLHTNEAPTGAGRVPC